MPEFQSQFPSVICAPVYSQHDGLSTHRVRGERGVGTPACRVRTLANTFRPVAKTSSHECQQCPQECEATIASEASAHSRRGAYRHNGGRRVLVSDVVLDHHAGPGFLRLASDRRIEVYFDYHAANASSGIGTSRNRRARTLRKSGGTARRLPYSLPSTLDRSEEHTSELQSPCHLVCRLLL